MSDVSRFPFSWSPTSTLIKSTSERKEGKARRREKREPERKKKGAFSPEFARASRDANDACAYLYCSWTWLEPTCQLTLIAWKEKKTCFSCTSAFVCDEYNFFSPSSTRSRFYFFFLLFPRAFIITHPRPVCFSFWGRAAQERKKERKRERKREPGARKKFALYFSLFLSLSLSCKTRADVNLTEEKEERKKESSLFLFSSSNSFTRANTHTHTHTQHININNNNNISLRGIRKRNTLKSRSAAALLSPSIEVDKKVKEE